MNPPSIALEKLRAIVDAACTHTIAASHREAVAAVEGPQAIDHSFGIAAAPTPLRGP